MALSREEQKRLEELEALLRQDDPKLAQVLSDGGRPRVNGTALAVAGVGVAVGIAMLVAGMRWHWGISVGGFVVMLASLAWLVLGKTPHGDRATAPTGRSTPSSPRKRATGRSFMDTLEDRWQRRQQGRL